LASPTQFAGAVVEARKSVNDVQSEYSNGNTLKIIKKAIVGMMNKFRIVRSENPREAARLPGSSLVITSVTVCRFLAGNWRAPTAPAA
jgi:hypothetical protein